MSISVEEIFDQLTLEEKAGLCSGNDFWHTKPVKRLGLESIMMSDGPHGLRKQMEDGKPKIAVCWPSGCSLASSFDRDLIAMVGASLGESAKAENIHTLLGPAINIKRNPLCGRNFEYLSEDPYLAGELAASYINGIQKTGVGACPKHFAANNQEYRRMTVSAEVEERALREIYLKAFEIAVTKSQPKAMMCSYNRINGVYSCENPWLLTKVLREDWHFNGIVMTDWGAMNNRFEALEAGLDLEMPSSWGETDEEIVTAIKQGWLDVEVLDTTVKRVLHWVEVCLEGAIGAPEDYNIDLHHKMAIEVEENCAVLLKNDGMLPLKKGKRIAFIGGFAAFPRYQGGGSSHINSYKVNAIQEVSAGYGEIIFAEGFPTDGTDMAPEVFTQAVVVAQSADAVVIFAGLPDFIESEGYDRKDLDLPKDQNELIRAICEVQSQTAVVIQAGSPVTMPWRDDVNAILYMYLGGEGVAEATLHLLYGEANPSGKLAETFPLRLQDTSCYLDYPGDGKIVRYSEGVFVGYRWYDKREIPVLFPFGHGLSYTTFEYETMTSSGTIGDQGDTIAIMVTVKNTGAMAGQEVVQLYVSPLAPKVPRPVKELKGFEKILLNPGESKTVRFILDVTAFSYWDARIGDWRVDNDSYRILVGGSSVELPLQVDTVLAVPQPKFVIDDFTTYGELLDSDLDSAAMVELAKQIHFTDPNSDLGTGTEELIRHQLEEVPLHSMGSFGLSRKKVNQVIEEIKERSK